MKKIISPYLLLVLTFFIPVMASSQSSDLGNWLIYLGNLQINERWNWHHEIQHRNYDALGDMEQLLIRTGIGFNLTEGNNNVLFGYGFINSQNYLDDLEEKVGVDEHRIFQQFITRQSFGRFSLQHRYRFEQRWIEEDYRFRFRYFLALNVALNSAEMADGTWYLSGYNEVFINGDGEIFDRNRLYGGLGYRLSSTLRFEVGYMNQFLGGAGRDQINLIAFVNF
ncbi:MAG: DUF2490 domain-containing protein [Bacteroidota bacterium]